VSDRLHNLRRKEDVLKISLKNIEKRLRKMLTDFNRGTIEFNEILEPKLKVFAKPKLRTNYLVQTKALCAGKEREREGEKERRREREREKEREADNLT
jgi:hypothetical protein